MISSEDSQPSFDDLDKVAEDIVTKKPDITVVNDDSPSKTPAVEAQGEEQATPAPLKVNFETVAEPSAPTKQTPKKSQKKEKDMPKFDSLKDKIVWKLKQKISNQKRISKLELNDVLMWRNLIVSSLIFLAGHLLFIMLTRWKWTVALIIGRIMLLQVLMSVCYIVSMRIVKNQDAKPPSLTISSEHVRQYMENLAERINKVISSYVNILLLKDVRVTVAFAVGLELFNRTLGKRMTALTLVYTIFNVAFIIPVIHELFEDEINKGYAIAKKEACMLYSKVKSRLPKNIRDMLENVKTTTNGDTKKTQ